MSVQAWGILATFISGLIVAYLTFKSTLANKDKELEIKKLEIKHEIQDESRIEANRVRDQLLADLRSRIEGKDDVIIEKDRTILEQNKTIAAQRQQIIDLQKIVSGHEKRPVRRIQE